jgi:hypothetical protein
MKRKGTWVASMCALLLAACAGAPKSVPEAACVDQAPIGRFKPGADLFLAQFDIKTDTDDLHSVAAVATVLSHPAFACVDHLAVAGTYGVQRGDYVDPEDLFSNAFGANWLDAHRDREGTVRALAMRIAFVLAEGGHVWIMEAGQSDVSAAALQQVRARMPDAPMRDRVHIVQHSSWNERSTAADALAYVQANTDYVKIPDGNATGNGSPGFNTTEDAAWAPLTSAPVMGGVWRQARVLAREKNGTGYNNRSIAAGGLDFSDTAEAMWIFGYEGMHGVDDFVATFAH